MASDKKQNGNTRVGQRVLALILCILMVAGVALLLVEVLVWSVSAEDAAEPYEDINVRVGLAWGTAAPDAYVTTSLYGYEVGIQNLTDDEKTWTPLFTTSAKSLCVTADGNLTKVAATDGGSGSYKMATSSSKVTVGGYHVELDRTFDTLEEARKVISDASKALSKVNLANGCYAFPAYVKGKYKVRVYDFGTEETATSGIKKIQSAFPDDTLSVVKPSKNCLTVTNPATDRIEFEFRPTDATELTLGLKAYLSPASANGEAYIATGASLLYRGVICFRQVLDSSGSGTGKFNVINVLPMEWYVEGVLPYEISSSWPKESLKAFAIVIRTYMLRGLNKRKSYGFDLYNTSTDQVYKGVDRVTASVKEAVSATRGIVLSYEGKLCEVYYSDCFGNCSAAKNDVWGGTAVPYLCAVETPWEGYSTWKKGLWISKVSAKELASSLRSAGYDELKGSSIESVEVLNYGKNSTYVQSVEITDNLGNKTTITGCSNIRSAFGKYCYSANFVIGQGKVDYTYDVVTPNSEEVWDSHSSVTLLDLAMLTIRTAFGVFNSEGDEGVSVISADSEGNVSVDVVNEPVMVLYSTAINIAPKYVTSREILTEVADSDTDFVIVGKGNGHGVGISQYGSKCLADFGYTCEQIIAAYFTGVSFTHRFEVS